MEDYTGTTRDKQKRQSSEAELGPIASTANSRTLALSNSPAGITIRREPMQTGMEILGQLLDKAAILMQDVWCSKHEGVRQNDPYNELTMVLGTGMKALDSTWVYNGDTVSEELLIRWHTSLIWEYSQWMPSDAAAKYDDLGHKLWEFALAIDSDPRVTSSISRHDFQNAVMNATSRNDTWRRITGETAPCTKICTRALTNTTMFVGQTDDRTGRCQDLWTSRQIYLMKKKLQ